MEYRTGDLQCLNLESTDLDRLASLADSYFSNRENEEEAFDLAFDSSSDDEDADVDGNFDHKEDEDIELMEVHMTERAKVQKFYAETCKCKLGPDEKACSFTLTLDDFLDSRNNCKELSSMELDLVILGTIQSSLNCNDTSISGRVEKNRQHARMSYFYHGKRICMRTFLFLHCIQNNRFYSLVRHYRKNGLTLRVHGNAKRLPSSASSAETVEQVVKFIKNTAEEQALLLPGRVPGFKRIDVKLLPSNLTKHGLWRRYADICTSMGQVSVGYSKFCDLWNQLCPFILIMRPATDLCWTCQKNNNKVHRTANLPEAEKAEAVRTQEEHLRLASGEREHYKSCCEESKHHVQGFLEEVDFTKTREPCSFNGTVHYSYDYAQQLHYPSDPNQPGPIYFKTPRKCALFGVCCEGIPRQVNFLIDESVLTGKGANSTISYVHYFFERHGLGETDAHLHADNCGAQNKNSAFVWYYLWRVMSGLHNTVNYHFLLPGHTKFAPDWCFGLVKQKTRHTFISSLFDIARVVEESAVVNAAELVGLHNGTVRVFTYDWVTYLQQYFKKLPQIKTYYHFRFDKDFPGTVFCKQHWFSEERAINLLRNENRLPQPGQLPAIVNPQGISRERAEYLYREIREFCHDGTENLVAPVVSD